jgi:DNA-binding beta-propeller fold protein YncE
VAESAGAYGVQVFDRDGEALEPLNPPHTTETTRQPMGIAVAPDGTVYVADRRHNQVFVYEDDGTYRDVLKPDGLDSWAPVGITVDGRGLIYVTEALDLPEFQRHKVWVLNPDGSVVEEFGERGDTSSDLMFPGWITVDDHRRIWVGDITGVKIFDADGQYLFRLRTEGDGAVGLPGGMAARGDRVYISDTINHRIVVYKTTPDAATFDIAFGQLGFGRNDFRYPSGIAVSASRIYIADRENGRVDIWTP